MHFKKVNVASRNIKNTNFVQFGVITRSSMGVFVNAGTGSSYGTTTESAECKAIIWAIQWAARNKWTHVIIESNNKPAISYLNKVNSTISWEGENTLKTAASFFCFFESISFSLCNSYGNKAPMTLLNNSAFCRFPYNFERPPTWLISQLRKDLLFCNP
ncbi:hypothetical protein ACHQM5_011163 [Ranunculus cassubicifolius]